MINAFVDYIQHSAKKNNVDLLKHSTIWYVAKGDSFGNLESRISNILFQVHLFVQRTAWYCKPSGDTI